MATFGPAAQWVARLPSSDAGEGLGKRTSSLAWRLQPLAIHALFTAASVLALVTLDAVWGLRVSGVFMAVGCLALAVREGRRSGGLMLTPLSYMFAMGVISYGVSAYAYADRIADGERLDFSVFELRPEAVAMAEAIYLVGVLAYHAGIQLIRPLPAAPTRQVTKDYFRATCIALWLIGFVLRAFKVGIGTAFAFALGTTAELAAVLLALGRARRRGVALWGVMAAGTAVELFFNVRTGLKGAIMVSFVPAVWYFLIEKRLRVWVLPLLGVLAFGYLAVVHPVVQTAREERAEEWRQDPLNSYVGVYKTGVSTRWTILESTRSSLGRQFNAGPLSFFYDDVERHGYRMGETLENVGYVLIPRLLWPDKPDVSRGAWFTAYLGAAKSEKTATSATGLTAVGEFYWNFGIPGVVCGMLLIGILGGAIWRIAGPHPELDPLRMLPYYAAIFVSVDQPDVGSVVGAAVSGILVYGVPTLIADYLTKRHGWSHAIVQAGPEAGATSSA